MRILVVSDIHANAAALLAVREEFDACVCLGDVVEYGPCPGPCVAWVRDHADVAVRGNHDHGAAHNVNIQGVSGFRFLTMQSRRVTAPHLSGEDRAFLAAMPVTRMVRLGGYTFLCVHASPRDPLDEYVAADPAAWAPQVAHLGVDFVLAGHTHVPMVLPVGGTTVVNPGSVGLSRDGDPRARYAVITDGVVELKQAEYDVSRTVAAVRASSLDPVAKDMLADVYTHGRYVHPPGLPHPYSAANGHSGKPSGRHFPLPRPAAGAGARPG